MTGNTSGRTPTFIQLTTRDGPLAQIWLASNMSHALSKTVSQQTDIVKSVKEITKVAGCSSEGEHVEPITLRVSGELLHGVVRVYSKKASLLLNDIKDTLTKITSLFRTNQTSLTLHAERTVITNLNQLMLQDTVTERDVLAVPELDFLGDHDLQSAFMGGETSMQRHVQGAAPWDTSIEVGRRFALDDDLDYDRSFELDLDFDIKDNASRSWGEGTQVSMNKSSLLQNVKAIDDDEDFPDGDEVAWDLGINEEGTQPGSEHDSDRSLELGRRATQEEYLHEQTEFDFDLDLDKVPNEEQSSTQEVQDDSEQNLTVRKSPKKTSALLNVKTLISDSDIELKDGTLKNESPPPVEEVPTPAQREILAGSKRLWVQISENLDYLPTSVVDNLLPYHRIKKQKTNDGASSQAETEDLHLDISLGLDNDLLSDEGSGDLDAITDRSRGLANDEASDEIVNGTSASADLHEFSNVSSEVLSNSQPQQIQLLTGETVPKETVDMAELLRTQFLTKDTTTFEEVTIAKSQNERSTDVATRRQASVAFFDILSLATMGCLDLEQQKEFGEIQIKGKASLYEKFLTA